MSQPTEAFWVPSKPSINLRISSGKDIESFFKELYPKSNPVLFSSARAGINAILVLNSATRPDLVFVPPYTPHCVFDSISRLATPTTENRQKSAIIIDYYSWGYGLPQNSFESIFIKDRADSFITEEYKLFQNNASFEIISCPKVFGSFMGGIVFCASEKNAYLLSEIRDKRGIQSSLMNHIFKIIPGIGNKIWQGIEAENGRISPLATRNLLKLLNKFEKIKKKRLSNIEYVKNHLPDFLEKGILPSALPIKLSSKNKSVMQSIGINITRMINLENYCIEKYQKVIPLPLHQGHGLKEVSGILSSIEHLQNPK